MINNLKEKIFGFLIAVFMVSGRWGIDRIIGDSEITHSNISLFELRLWIVILVVLFVLFPYALNKNEAMLAKIRLFVFSLSLFFFFIMLTYFWSRDPEIALIKLYDISLLLIALLCLYRILICNKGSLVGQYIWQSLIFLTGFLASIAIYKAFTGDPGRLSVLGGGPNVFGRLMGLLCLGSLYLWRTKSKSWKWLPVTVISFLLVILSGSRGSLIAIFAAAGFFMLMEKINLRNKVVMAVIISLIGSTIFFLTPFGDQVSQVYQSRIQSLLVEQQYPAGRMEMYEQAFKLGQSNFLLGAGLSAFAGRGYGVYPHNLFLEIFSECGLVGLLLLTLVIYSFISGIYYLKLTTPSVSTSLAAIILFLVASQFSGDIYDNRNLFIFMLMSYSAR